MFTFQLDHYVLSSPDSGSNAFTIWVNFMDGVIINIVLQNLSQEGMFTTLVEDQFITIFPDGQDILNNAMEAEASE